MIKRVDSHHHVWRLDRGDYDWLTPDDYPTLQRDFGAPDLAPLLAEFAINTSVLIQAAETIAETRHMLAVAEQNDFIEAVVGWVDITRTDAPDTLATLAGNPLFRGIRPMIVFQDDMAWPASSNMQRALEELSRLSLVFDALVAAEQLDGLRDVMVANPDLPFVINHFGYPDIAGGDIAGWRESMAAIARDTCATVKFSGVMMDLGGDRPAADFRPAADHLLEHFGPKRLMWGSDWPHLLADSDYPAWYALSASLLDGVSPEDRAWLYGGTAARVYGL
jgi:L-fuconolactonase